METLLLGSYLIIACVLYLVKHQEHNSAFFFKHSIQFASRKKDDAHCQTYTSLCLYVSIIYVYMCVSIICMCVCLSSVQFSHSVVSNSLRPHESQHARPPCPSPTPGVHPDSRPSSQRCHPAISSSVVPFSSCPQPLPASESFPMSQLFA